MASQELDALLAAAAACAVTAALTPVVGRVARHFGLLDEPRDRGLSQRMTPLLGGIAIFAGVVAAMLVWLPMDATYRSILIGATIITVVGAIDDIIDLHPALKLAGQVGAVTVPVANGVQGVGLHAAVRASRRPRRPRRAADDRRDGADHQRRQLLRRRRRPRGGRLRDRGERRSRSSPSTSTRPTPRSSRRSSPGRRSGSSSTTSTRRRSSWATAGRTCSATCSAR